jgi:hypothetical protein
MAMGWVLLTHVGGGLFWNDSLAFSICYFMPRKINKKVRKQGIRVMAKAKCFLATRLKPKLVLIGLWLHKCTWKVVLLKKVSFLYVCKRLPSISQTSKCCGDQPTWQNVFHSEASKGYGDHPTWKSFLLLAMYKKLYSVSSSWLASGPSSAWWIT